MREQSIEILFDLQPCITEPSEFRGIGCYSRELFKSVVTCSKEEDIRGFVFERGRPGGSDIYQKLDDKISRSRIHRFPAMPHFDTPCDYNGGERDSLCGELYNSCVQTINPNVIHLSHIFEGYSDSTIVPFLNRPPGQCLSATLYDLIPLRFPEHYFQSQETEKWYRFRLQTLCSADLLLSISEASRQDAIELLDLDPDKVVTIHGGIASCFKPIKDKEKVRFDLLKQYKISQKRIVLYVGGDEYRKNLDQCVEAFAKLSGKTKACSALVIICQLSKETERRLCSLAKKHGISQHLYLLNYISSNDLNSFYNICDVFIFPSLYEGLGLPIIEAMACGAPVIGSNSSSIQEVIPSKEALFDPKNSCDIAQLIEKTLTVPQFSNQLREKGVERAADFTWKKTGLKALDAYRHLIKKKNKESITAVSVGYVPRKRLAVFTPLPPIRSGISDYSAEFYPYLGKYFAIDFFVEPSKVDHTALNAIFRIFSIEDFEKNAELYDVILYEIGNSEFHTHMFSLLREYPGIIVLHDAFLSNIMLYQGSDIALKEALYSHGTQGAYFLNHQKGLSLPMSKRIIDDAYGVIVHSPFNVDISRQFYPEGTLANYSVIPQVIRRSSCNSPEKRAEARARLGFKEGDIIIASFGFVAQCKSHDLILEAFAKSGLAKKKHCYLAFVGGSVDLPFSDALEKRIKQMPCSKRIKIVGFAQEDVYADYLQVADVAVQLRKESRGGTSKSVLDCLASGLPLVMNRVPTFTDYPTEIAYFLSPEPTEKELAEALDRLYCDEELRLQYKKTALEYVHTHHNGPYLAKKYAVAIHEMSSAYQRRSQKDLMQRVAPHLIGLRNPDEAKQSIIFYHNSISNHRYLRPKLYIGVSHAIKNDGPSEVQPIVKATIKELYQRKTGGIDPIAVELSSNKQLIQADKWLQEHKISMVNLKMIQENVKEYKAGDWLLMLDYSLESYPLLCSEFQRVRGTGAQVITAVYDLLALRQASSRVTKSSKKPFEKWIQLAIQESNGLVCASKTVADQLIDYIQKNRLGRPGLKVGWWHLGSSLPVKEEGLPKKELRHKSYALMVGILDPRKNYHLALDAFEILWSQGHSLELVVIGKKGCFGDSLVERLEAHPEKNSKLFVYYGLSDEELGQCYKNALFVLALSTDEGFALPLIEAAHHHIPIVCTDIPVFREVVKNHATYISISSAQEVAKEITSWIEGYQQGKHVCSSEVPKLSRNESSETLVDVVVNENWYWKS